VPEALSDGGSAGSKGRAYVMLVCFFNYRIIFLSRRKKKTHVCVIFCNEHKEEARAPLTNTGNLTPSPGQCYSVCWRMRQALKKANAGRIW
jgi:hypothetical protein